MHSRDLHDGWTIHAHGAEVPDAVADAEIPVTVPGTSHTALLDAGLIPDPYIGTHELDVAWMHRADWRFTTTFDEAGAAADERVDLVFAGIDTVATVSLGGRELGRTANMHRSYRFDVRDLADGGAHDLVVDVRSALSYGEAERDRLGARPAAYPHPLNMVRKMACSFGWDWGPDLQTAGLWRPVHVERWRVARLASVRPLVGIRLDGVPYVRVHVDVERSGLTDAGPLTIRAAVAGAAREVTIPADASTAVVEIAAPEAELWWPVGHGEQPLYELDVELVDGEVRDTWQRRIGFRTVDVDETPDEHGTPWTLRVNGTPIFVKGANWIPDDHLLTRITRERLERRIDQALGANLNLLRVWGGGIYESRDFYELCDERGVLVWQDFLLACAAYPEEEPLAGELEAEARENVARLTPHPSLVVWNGGNENVWGFLDWGWRAELDGATWGYGYATELLPRVVAELDPTRPYSWNSPSSPGFALDERHPNDPDHGTHHQWEVWNRLDYTHYASEIPRFCSEFGFQGPPAWATLERAVRPADGVWSTEDAAFLLHQKAADGNAKLDAGLAPHLGVPEDFADWHWATQLNQARAVAFAIEHYRSWWPRTAGAIVWQLNDCWPVTSWAAVDSDERVKPLWFALRHAFADRLVRVVERDGVPVVALVNDTAAPWSGAARATRETFAGEVLAEEAFDVVVAPRSVALVPLPTALRTPLDAAAEAVVVRFGDERTVHLFVEDVDAALDPASISAEVTPVEGGYRVEVRARSLTRDVALLVDRLDPAASVDDALVTLPAGESVTFHVRTAVALDSAALTSAPVLRTANDVVGAALGRSGSALV